MLNIRLKKKNRDLNSKKPVDDSVYLDIFIQNQTRGTVTTFEQFPFRDIYIRILTYLYNKIR